MMQTRIFLKEDRSQRPMRFPKFREDCFTNIVVLLSNCFKTEHLSYQLVDNFVFIKYAFQGDTTGDYKRLLLTLISG